ncbi:succinate-semialdehyde dehydrogenase/glutarate-semialdehyde dehydrogenase [Arthrobacter sp. V4I6]|uniref:NAD-dependent succinate-semialdehyde dehydrogenase n=1 Tax=unclassified Arthrobacter TaxID=235627 RepID=UPI0027824DB7|nr:MULTISPECIES: NAD-dependent succinate-semialdehyde dehydrogenase [unclassified Arthrobacter]MDQ0822074.1 succinate-semialdehyde dehydrogenase/glutarate-semialdehyde dehydrogenase [Arthrobacter sp. V1I7]MDQ0856342.1 succinate-semialdehyde dehydrogenase/glutarate-semialdehyde dehydrogenase [Arthrobacter sp. V4I6]
MSRYRIQNPATGEVIETFEAATGEQIEQVLASADAAYHQWREQSIQDRAAVVRRIAELFEERKEELAKIIAQEMGKPLSEGIEEVEFAASIVNYYGVHGPSLAVDQEVPSTISGKAIIENRPVGALLGVMPWNFPYYQVARFAAPNLILGNTILLKHADICPRSALAIQQIMEEAGVPVGGYTNVFATHDQVATMIADPRVQGVSLTGSERAGAIIGEQAGRHLKKAVLELGGTDAMIVLDSDDLASIAADGWNFRVYNSGQACNANKRMIVMEDIYDEFVAQLKKLADGLVPGDPLNMPEHGYGPLSSRAAAEQVNAQVQRAVADGATLEVGGVLSEGKGAYFSPAVLTGISRESASFREEIFGPVAIVFKASSDEEALELANDSDFGLGGSVFSTDKARAAKIASRLDVGMAHVNIIAAEAAELPFGGVKRSGFGREMGPLGMSEFVNKRLYFVAD